jgi:hypothetical protein
VRKDRRCRGGGIKDGSEKGNEKWDESQKQWMREKGGRIEGGEGMREKGERMSEKGGQIEGKLMRKQKRIEGKGMRKKREVRCVKNVRKGGGDLGKFFRSY